MTSGRDDGFAGPVQGKVPVTCLCLGSIGAVLWNLLVAFVLLFIVPWPFRILPAAVAVVVLLGASLRMPLALRLDVGGTLRIQKGVRRIRVAAAEMRSVEIIGPASHDTPLFWRPRWVEFKWDGGKIVVWTASLHLGELVATLATMNPEIPPFF